ncbi:hypothetical protein ACJX0J_033600 [Zea mays]
MSGSFVSVLHLVLWDLFHIISNINLKPGHRRASSIYSLLAAKQFMSIATTLHIIQKVYEYEFRILLYKFRLSFDRFMLIMIPVFFVLTTGQIVRSLHLATSILTKQDIDIQSWDYDKTKCTMLFPAFSYISFLYFF